ncbi:hypothetical protein ACQPZF_36290 [Actinosynnema sp. CS-041913]
MNSENIDLSGNYRAVFEVAPALERVFTEEVIGNHAESGVYEL